MFQCRLDRDKDTMYESGVTDNNNMLYSVHVHDHENLEKEVVKHSHPLPPLPAGGGNGLVKGLMITAGGQ